MKQKKTNRKKANRWLKLLLPDGKLRDAMELYPGKTRAEVQELIWKELKKKLVLGGTAFAFFLILAVVSAAKNPEQTGIVRPAPGKASAKEEVLLETEEGWQELILEVGALEYEETQLEAMHQTAENYLEQAVLGENESWDKVKTDLFFPETLAEYGGKLYWSTDAPWVINVDGEVQNAELTEVEQVMITAKIFYGSEYRYFSRLVTVYPREYTGDAAVLRKVQLELRQQEQASRTLEQFVLPESVLGYPVKEAGGDSFRVAAFLVLLSVVIPLLLYSGYFGDIDTKRKKRKEQAEASYLGFVTKLSLMMAAGITVRQAFNRLAGEYEKNYGAKHVLSMELKVTRQELDNGHSEQEAYEAFGRRLGVLAYRRLSSLLTQNVSRGVQGIRNLLLLEAKEVMAKERAGIKVRGEQAGTKLLFPMMGLLFLVFAILLVPAFRTF